jgi:hypothetical protein
VTRQCKAQTTTPKHPRRLASRQATFRTILFSSLFERKVCLLYVKLDIAPCFHSSSLWPPTICRACHKIVTWTHMYFYIERRMKTAARHRERPESQQAHRHDTLTDRATVRPTPRPPRHPLQPQERRKKGLVQYIARQHPEWREKAGAGHMCFYSSAPTSPLLAFAWACQPGPRAPLPSAATAGPSSSRVTVITPSPAPALPCSGRCATTLSRQVGAIVLPRRASTSRRSPPSASSPPLPHPLPTPLPEPRSPPLWEATLLNPRCSSPTPCAAPGGYSGAA